MKKKISKNELESFAEEIFNLIQSSKTTEATLITLSGDLGAGKTTVASAFAKLLGVKEVIISPTFIIERVYEIPNGNRADKFSRLIHIDAYRLQSGSELEKLSFKEKLEDEKAIIILEWPERVEDALPSVFLSLTFEHIEDEPESRFVTIKQHG